MYKKIRFKIIDCIVGLLFLAAAAFSLFYALNHKQGKTVLMVSDGKREWVYPLDIDKEIEVKGDLGISRIRIENGQAQFLDSPCSNHVCIQSPPLRRNGDWSACLPNQVFMYVEGDDSTDTGFDAVGF